MCCFSHSTHSVLPQQLLYHRRMSIISNPKTYLQRHIFQTRKCILPKCIGCIIQLLIQIFGFQIEESVMNNEYSKFLYIFQIKL